MVVIRGRGHLAAGIVIGWRLSNVSKFGCYEQSLAERCPCGEFSFRLGNIGRQRRTALFQKRRGTLDLRRRWLPRQSTSISKSNAIGFVAVFRQNKLSKVPRLLSDKRAVDQKQVLSGHRCHAASSDDQAGIRDVEQLKNLWQAIAENGQIDAAMNALLVDRIGRQCVLNQLSTVARYD